MEKSKLGSSFNKQEEILNFLKSDCPEVFSEGKIDCKKLKQTLGEDVDDGNERYGLSWAGKSNCFRVIQEQTTATLKPSKTESVNFDQTQNLFIEGDNLEVLKVLQRSYYGKVKMIYIDPPYNTGGDFIYNDDFRKSKKEELIDSGEMNGEGDLTRADGLSTNRKDSNGHFHSDWLNMMYPRLFLARNLLRQDGAIFISIDDNEVGNLRKICEEIFGEENVEQYIWNLSDFEESSFTKTASNTVRFEHEYIIACFRNDRKLNKYSEYRFIERTDFSNPDNDPRGDWMSGNISRNGITSTTGKKYFTIKTPTGAEYTRNWTVSADEYEELLKDNRIFFSKGGDGVPRLKIFKNESSESIQSSIFSGLKTSITGKNQIKELFDDKILFDFPKPTTLISRILQIASDKDEKNIILDFFAGSGTTAQAVMEQNEKDGGNRKWICVQIPEITDEESEAYKVGYKTIAEIGKERVRRAGKKIEKEAKNKTDLGFKVLRLDSSNFKIWQGKFDGTRDLLSEMKEFVDNVQKGSAEQDILFELILKSGLDLNVPVDEKDFGGEKYYSLDGGKLIVYLGRKITKELAGEIQKAKPERFICLDGCFQNNDQLKTNISLQMEQEKIDFKVI